MVWKLFGTTLGVFFLSLVLLLFYWTQWDEDAREHARHIARNVEVMERFWNQEAGAQSGRLKLGYREIAETGFPFDLRIRLLQPYVRDIRGSRSFTLTTPYLEFRATGSPDEPYELRYPIDGHAIMEDGGGKIVYYLSLSDMMPLSLRRTMLQGKSSAMFNEYGLTYPETLVFKADRNGRVQRYPMRFTSTEEPLLRPMLRDMRARLERLRGLLAEDVR